MSERILTGIYPVNDYRSYLRHGDEVERKYGLPDKKKYPMPDRDHVMSAIKFFNYVSPADEKELARNIIARIKEYGITDINVGENNRFGKYYKPDYLEHSAKGQTWNNHKYLYITPNGTYVYPKKKRKPVDDYWLWDSKDIDRDTYVNVGRTGRNRPKRYSIRDYYIPDQSHPEIVAVSYKRGYVKAHKPGERNQKKEMHYPRQKGTIKRLKKYYFENGKYSFANSKKRSKQNRIISRVLKNRIR